MANSNFNNLQRLQKFSSPRLLRKPVFFPNRPPSVQFGTIFLRFFSPSGVILRINVVQQQKTKVPPPGPGKSCRWSLNPEHIMKKQLLLSALLLAGLSGALRAQSVTLIDWNHQWKFFHPMGAMPANAGNFATTWYLPDAQYDSPLPFGAVPEVVGIPGTADRYDSGNGRSPLGYGTIDVANNAAFTSFGQTAEPSLFTTPDATRRYAGYFKTTFVVPAGGVSSPTLEFLCDDGGYVYLDGTLIASINITAGVADAYTSFAMNATDTETDTYVLNLSTGGARNLTGKLLATRLMPVNVTTAVPLLTAGTHTLEVVFTPTDTLNYCPESATVTLVVNRATPTLAWSNPADIVYGIALSATELNATASVAGTFVYSPAAGVCGKAMPYQQSSRFGVCARPSAAGLAVTFARTDNRLGLMMPSSTIISHVRYFCAVSPSTSVQRKPLLMISLNVTADL